MTWNIHYDTDGNPLLLYGTVDFQYAEQFRDVDCSVLKTRSGSFITIRNVYYLAVYLVCLIHRATAFILSGEPYRCNL